MLRNLQGEIVPFGKTARTLEETFLASRVLPSWLETASPYAIIGPDIDYGYLQVNGGALTICPRGLHMGKLREVIVELDSLCLSSPVEQAPFFFSLTDAWGLSGFQLCQMTEAGHVAVTVKHPTGGEKTKDVYYQLEHLRRPNLAIRLRCDGTLVLMEHDSVAFEHRFSPEEMDCSAVLLPRVGIRTAPGSEHWFRVSRVALTVIHN